MTHLFIVVNCQHCYNFRADLFNLRYWDKITGTRPVDRSIGVTYNSYDGCSCCSDWWEGRIICYQSQLKKERILKLNIISSHFLCTSIHIMSAERRQYLNNMFTQTKTSNTNYHMHFTILVIYLYRQLNPINNFGIPYCISRQSKNIIAQISFQFNGAGSRVNLKVVFSRINSFSLVHKITLSQWKK